MDKENAKVIRKVVAKRKFKSVEEMIRTAAADVWAHRLLDECWKKCGFDLHKNPKKLTDKEIQKLLKVFWKED